MSSLESRKLTLEVSEFALSDLVRGASADVSHIAEQHQSKVCCFIDPSLPEKVIGDAIRLREVLSTLLLTALSSAQSAQIHLSVFASGERSLELDLTFEINAGSQAKNAQLHQLPQIKKTVDLLGGDLGLEERRDATPVFWCRFPFQRPPFTSDISAKPRADQEHAFPVRCKYPVRILMA